MRILIVTPLVPPEPGGPSYYSVALKEALERAGQKVVLKAFRDVRHLPTGIRHLLFLWHVFRLASKADVLIVLDTFSVALPSVIAARCTRKKVILRTGGDFVWEHFVERTGEPVLLSEFYEKISTGAVQLSVKERLVVLLQKHIVFPLTHTVVYSTDWQRNLWERPYALARERTAIIENSAPDEALRPPPQPSQLEKKRGFLYLGRPTRVKNIQALKAGHALYAERIGSRALPLQVLENVPRSVYYDELLHARAVVVPSLSDVSPNSVLEALAYNVPVIVTRDCGMRARLGDAVTYIDPRSPEVIADALATLSDERQYETVVARAAAFSYVRTYDDLAKEFLLLCNDL